MKIFYSLIGLWLSTSGIGGQTFDDIDRSLYRRIDLKPRCDAISITYVTGESVPLQALCQPFKLAVDHADAWGDYVTIWEDRVEGPRVELINGVNLTKAAYVLNLTAASSAFSACTASAVSSFITNSAFCLLDGVMGSDSYKKCYNDELESFIEDITDCQKRRDKRLDDAVLGANRSISTFIDAYSGCQGLEAMVELWQDYWATLIEK